MGTLPVGDPFCPHGLEVDCDDSDLNDCPVSQP